MIKITATTKNGMQAYIKKLEDAIGTGAAEVAEQVRDRWASHAHVVTGSYKEGLYVQTHDSSDFSQKAALAASLNPKAKIVSEPPRPTRKGAARVGATVAHALPEEMGTSDRPAHPALVPAAQETKRAVTKIYAKKVQP